MRDRVRLSAFVALLSTTSSVLPASAVPSGALDRLARAWSALRDYKADIYSHEQIGDRASDHTLRYDYRRPDRARLDIVSGTPANATLIWTGSDTIVAYRRGFAFFKMRGDARSDALTSIRGNGILTPNTGDIVACFQAHRSAVRERPGPTVFGTATDEIALPYVGVACPDDSPLDRKTITLDVLDLDPASGLIVQRHRYAGSELVERWIVTARAVDIDIPDGEFH